MNVLAELEKLQKAAMRDPVLRQQLLQSREAAEPVSRFCKVARGAGYDINEMDIIYAGKRHTQACEGLRTVEERTRLCSKMRMITTASSCLQ